MAPPAEWHPYEHGQSIGTTGSEQGKIIEDQEHGAGARITLEQLQPRTLARFAITCGLYGWFFHTCYFGKLDEAHTAFREMKIELERIIGLLPDAADDREGADRPALEAIDRFVKRFPT